MEIFAQSVISWPLAVLRPRRNTADLSRKGRHEPCDVGGVMTKVRVLGQSLYDLMTEVRELDLLAFRKWAEGAQRTLAALRKRAAKHES